MSQNKSQATVTIKVDAESFKSEDVEDYIKEVVRQEMAKIGKVKPQVEQDDDEQ